MRKPRHTAALAASTALVALMAGLPAAADVIVPEGDAGTALRLDADFRPLGRIKGLGNVHGLAVAPRRGLLIAGSLSEVARSEIDRPATVSKIDHAAHHGDAMKKPAGDEEEVGFVTFVDIATGQIRRRVEVPAGVHHVTVDAGERWAVVTHPAPDAASVIDLDSGKVTATVETGANPNYAVFDDRTGRFYVSNAADSTIVAIDPATGRKEATIATPGGVEHMVIDAAGRRIWGAEADAGRVDEIDLDTSKVLRSFEIGGMLHGITRDPASGTIYVAARETGRIGVIDPATGSLSMVEAGPEPYHMEIADGRLVVSSAADDVVRAFGLSDLKPIGEVPVRARGHEMVVLTN